MTDLPVNDNNDFTGQNLTNITSITFNGEFQATFSSSQFGTGKISTSVQINAPTNTSQNSGVEIALASAGTFSAANFVLSDPNRISTAIDGTSGNDTITGTSGFTQISDGDGGVDNLSLGAGYGYIVTEELGSNRSILNGGTGGTGTGQHVLAIGSRVAQLNTDYFQATLSHFDLLAVLGSGVITAGFLGTQLGAGAITELDIDGADIDPHQTLAGFNLDVTGTTVNLSALTFDTWDSTKDTIAIVGSGVSNHLTGSSKNDSISGGAGADTMAGGAGNDTYFVNNTGDVVTENAGAGTDTVHTTVTYTLSANVENLILDGSGNLTGTGNTLNNILTGNAGNNSLYGGDGNDTASGGDGNDILVLGNGNDSADGGNGNDYFYAGAGNDILTGGAGLDVLEGEDGNDSIYGGTGFNYLFGGAGNDLLLGSGGSAASDVNVMYGGDGNDNLYGGLGTNYFYGGTGVDTMFGGSGENLFISSGETDGNFIYGGSGQNYVYGSNGGDTVTGGTNVDVFLMGSGNDNITGGGGTDYAWGGGGSDTFNMSDAQSDVMVINDFNTGGVSDVLNFSGTSLHSFADVQAAEFYSAGINTTIITDAAGNADWLIGIAPSQLNASMFTFS